MPPPQLPGEGFIGWGHCFLFCTLHAIAPIVKWLRYPPFKWETTVQFCLGAVTLRIRYLRRTASILSKLLYTYDTYIAAPKHGLYTHAFPKKRPNGTSSKILFFSFSYHQNLTSLLHNPMCQTQHLTKPCESDFAAAGQILNSIHT